MEKEIIIERTNKIFEEVLKERLRQIDKGNSYIQDDHYTNCQLRDYAVYYIAPHLRDYFPRGWNENAMNAPFNCSYRDRIVTMMALGAAELDRLDRLENGFKYSESDFEERGKTNKVSSYRVVLDGPDEEYEPDEPDEIAIPNPAYKISIDSKGEVKGWDSIDEIKIKLDNLRAKHSSKITYIPKDEL